MALKKKKKLYEGRTKTLHETESTDQLIMSFKDSLPGSDGPAGVIEGKGAVNNRISAALFRYAESFNIPTHFLAEAGKDAMVVRHLKMFPFYAVIRNLANSKLAKALGVKDGSALEAPAIEFFLKGEDKKAAPLTRADILASALATAEEMLQIEHYVKKINAVLKSFFQRRGLVLEEFRLEFGRHKNRVAIGDEISMDTCKLRDSQTNERFDVSRLKNDTPALESVYDQIGRRVLNLSGN